MRVGGKFSAYDAARTQVCVNHITVIDKYGPMRRAASEAEDRHEARRGGIDLCGKT